MRESAVAAVVLVVLCGARPGGASTISPGEGVLHEVPLLELVGQYGGTVGGVDAAGMTAYMAHSHRLVLYDVTDPSAPDEIISSQPLPGQICDLIVAEGFAFVTLQLHRAGHDDASTAFAILDLAVLPEASPTALLELPGDSCLMDKIGHHVFVANGSAGLVVIDVSDVAQARVVGTLGSIAGETWDVVATNHYAFVTEDSDLRVVDVSDPRSPREVARQVGQDLPATLDVADGHAFVARSNVGVAVFDVRDPRDPRLVSTFGSPSLGFDVVVGRDLAYVSHRPGGGTMEVYDVSDPAAPTEADRVSGIFFDLHLDGDRAFAVSSTDGMFILDVTDAGSVHVAGGVEVEYSVDDVAVDGVHGYVATGPIGMDVLALSDPAAPSALASVDVPAVGLAVQDGYAVTASGELNLNVVDVRDPAAPRVVATVPAPPSTEGRRGGSFWCAGIDGAYIYTSVGYEWGATRWGSYRTSELHVYDATDRSNPIHVGAIPDVGRGDWCHAIAIMGSYAYLAAGDLLVSDVVDPTAPRLVARAATRAAARDLHIADGYAYVAEFSHRDPGLEVFDLTDPNAPRAVGWASTPDGAQDVYVTSDLAFVASEDAGVRLIDVSDPTAPLEVGWAATPRSAQHVYVAGRHVYAATNAGGLLVWRISDALMPNRAYLPLAADG